MKVSKHIHSFVEIEDQGDRLLIDPGSFSFIEKKIDPANFRGVSGILITHNHSDHFDPAALEIILKNNPDAQIITNEQTREKLPQFDEKIVVLEKGEIALNNFKIQAFPAEHGKMPFPGPTNTAFLINEVFLHPGDSLDPVIFNHRTKVLALPVTAPWLTWVESWNFAENFKPEIIMPIHDGYIKDFFKDFIYSAWDKMLGEKGIKFSQNNDVEI